MSLDVNSRLMEEATELIPELVGTGLELVMENNIAHGDMEALWQNLIQARSLLTNNEDWQLSPGTDVF